MKYCICVTTNYVRDAAGPGADCLVLPVVAPACSASPPLPHSYSSSDRSKEAPHPAGTGTGRALRPPACAPAPLAKALGRAQALRRPASSRGPREVR